MLRRGRRYNAHGDSPSLEAQDTPPSQGIDARTSEVCAVVPTAAAWQEHNESANTDAGWSRLSDTTWSSTPQRLDLFGPPPASPQTPVEDNDQTAANIDSLKRILLEFLESQHK
ncbi:hypothetical protein V5799_004295 [Amblyomma americanum]|uniref:Uncharacterized protein n=1 Tax=Amblyomma americanum TaxID=6943 RepID=A0AAQ4D6I1_AMBAM